MTATTFLRLAVAAGSIAAVISPATGDVVAAGDTACGGVVFADLDADGRRTETLDRDLRPDDVEDGVRALDVVVVDVHGTEHRTRTGRTGEWSVDLEDDDYPIRIEFVLPDGHAAGAPGPDSGGIVQFAADADDCDRDAVGDLGVFRVAEFCASKPELAVPCYVTSDHEAYGDEPAIVAVSNAATDNASTTAASIDDWLRPSKRVLAVHSEVGTVYGQAARRDGTIYAAAFTKRHTRLETALNPSGNPTAIYRIEPGEPATILTVLDRSAPNPHGPDDGGVDDLGSMDAVFTSGIGDVELSPDERTLYAIDLGRRELAVVDAVAGGIRRRVALDGAALGRTGCAVSAGNRFGDLRPFGLGWRDDTLLVGVVCSAESTVDVDRPVIEDARPGTTGGDHDGLVGYVYGFADGRFEQLLAWRLAADRGETQDNGLVSNDAYWHPWVPAYPFDAEHDVVSYPQPAITDLAVDDQGNLIIAIADRWGHQTAPSRPAPSWDGATRDIEETVAAGDLQRACRRGDGWVIEGSDGCEGGFGNGWEFFDGDSYGWHAETAMGSVARLPGRSEVVVTQMTPSPRRTPGGPAVSPGTGPATATTARASACTTAAQRTPTTRSRRPPVSATWRCCAAVRPRASAARRGGTGTPTVSATPVTDRSRAWSSSSVTSRATCCPST